MSSTSSTARWTSSAAPSTGPSPPPTSGRSLREPTQPPRRQQAERHAPVRGRPVRRRDLRLGQPQAGAPAGHRVPGHHRRRAVSRGRFVRRDRAGQQADRARHRLACRGWRSSSRRRRTRSRWSSPSSRSAPTSRRRRPRSRTRSPRRSLPASVTPTVQALNINASPVVISSIAATRPDGLEEVATIARTEIVPEIAAIEGVARADLTGGLERRASRSPSTRPSWPPPGISSAAGGRRPRRQQPDPPVRPAARRRVEDPGLDDRHAHLGRRRSRASSSGSARRPCPPATAAAAALAGASRAATQPSAAPVAPEADHHRRPRHRRARSRSPTTGYGRTNGQPALTLTVSKTSNANTVEVADAVQAKLTEIAARHPDQMTVTTVPDLSVFIKESRDGLAPRGRPRRALRDPDDLPVPVQPARDDRRRDQHPALDPDRARDHAADRRHHQHHDPGRPGGRRRTRGRRRDRRPREHLSPPRARRGSADRGHQRAQGGRRRDHRQHADDRRGLPAARLRRRPRHRSSSCRSR